MRLKAYAIAIMPADATVIAGPEREADRVMCGSDETAAEHGPLAEGEVHHARGLVDHHEGESDQRVERTGERAVDEERDEEQHAAV
jgi:hypothetical protein